MNLLNNKIEQVALEIIIAQGELEYATSTEQTCNKGVEHLKQFKKDISEEIQKLISFEKELKALKFVPFTKMVFIDNQWVVCEDEDRFWSNFHEWEQPDVDEFDVGEDLPF